MKDKVSIITPTYNAAKYIGETIDSVQNQTYSNWEMIIVDDASTDNTVAIVEAIQAKDSRISLVHATSNEGSGKARDLGVQKSTGRYIAFLDADDLWKPHKLKTQIDFMINRGLNFTFSYYECIDENSIPIGRLISAPNPLTLKQLISSNYIGNLTGIYNTEYFGKIPISHVRKRQDWMLWLDILKKNKTAYPVPESLAYYRIHSNSLSSSKFGLLKYNYRVYHQHLNKNKVTSFFYLLRFLFVHFFIKKRYIKKLQSL